MKIDFMSMINLMKKTWNKQCKYINYTPLLSTDFYCIGGANLLLKIAQNNHKNHD